MIHDKNNNDLIDHYNLAEEIYKNNIFAYEILDKFKTS